VGQGRVHVNAWAKGFLMGKLIDISGQHFGLLTIVCREGNQQGYSGTIWRCRCECGKEVVVYKGNLTSGKSLSCGCLGNTRKTKHGMCKSSAYSSWSGAIQRTTNPKNEEWNNYGGRGITTCREWRKSFKTFWDEMGETWEEGLTLDRINVNGNYCKENCRWATDTEQSHNQRKKNNCSSAYKGVYWSIVVGKWSSNIQQNRKREHLGYFFNELDAGTAYDNRSEELYGDRPNGTIKINSEIA